MEWGSEFGHLIGNLHGYASELKALLAKMDYQVIDGIWQHSERKVIFLGDFVDTVGQDR